MKQARVPAADHQPDTWKDIAPWRQPARINVGLDVIDPDERNVQGQGQHLGTTDPNEQCADETRRVMHSHAADLIEADACLLERLVRHRQQTLQVGPSSDLGHDAAEPGMQVRLGSHDIGENG